VRRKINPGEAGSLPKRHCTGILLSLRELDKNPSWTLYVWATHRIRMRSVQSGANGERPEGRFLKRIGSLQRDEGEHRQLVDPRFQEVFGASDQRK
jgi:hypothetical protein